MDSNIEAEEDDHSKLPCQAFIADWSVRQKPLGVLESRVRKRVMLALHAPPVPGRLGQQTGLRLPALKGGSRNVAWEPVGIPGFEQLWESLESLSLPLSGPQKSVSATFGSERPPLCTMQFWARLLGSNASTDQWGRRLT